MDRKLWPLRVWRQTLPEGMAEWDRQCPVARNARIQLKVPDPQPSGNPNQAREESVVPGRVEPREAGSTAET